MTLKVSNTWMRQLIFNFHITLSFVEVSLTDTKSAWIAFFLFAGNFVFDDKLLMVNRMKTPTEISYCISYTKIPYREK